jgi:putative addiction module component (TIGR02574 family)
MEGMNMFIVAKKVIDEVLLLPADARMNLVEQLLTSLNLPTQPEIDRLWAKEVERRIAQIDKGKVKLLPGAKVFSDIRKKYRGLATT